MRPGTHSNERDSRRAPKRDQLELIGTAERYVEDLAERVDLLAAVVAGSVARGDFNVWSDIDVIVVSQELPARLPERLGFLLEGAPPGIQTAGFTPEELRLAFARRNRLVLEAVERGIVLRGQLQPLLSGGDLDPPTRAADFKR